MSTIQAIYQSGEDTTNEKEFKYQITDSVQNNNSTKAATANQNMKSLTDVLISLQKDINVYLTSKLHEENIEDTIGDDDDDNNEEDDIKEE